MKRIIITLMSVGAFWLSNCQKPDAQHFVPNVRVNMNISTNLPQYNNLNFIHGAVYLDGGYNGLIAYRASDDEIKVYDRQAPFNVADGCQVSIDSNSVTTCSDTCSGSQWLLMDGQVLRGPAVYSLRAYTTSFDGANLDIFN